MYSHAHEYLKVHLSALLTLTQQACQGHIIGEGSFA